MKRKRSRQGGIGALDLIEEATHLLRRAPARVLASYYVGSAAFVLGFLYFWADMARGAGAADRHAEAAFSLSLLFIWMKCWQAVFCAGLRSLLLGGEPVRWTLRRALRVASVQTAVQPTGLLVLPVALLITLPFGWAYAFYQNVTVLGDGSDSGIKAATTRGREQAALFPRQNHVFLLVLVLFGFLVFLNMAVFLSLVPELLRMLFGIETVFTRAGSGLMNTTFLAVTMAMTYLAVDPLVKAVYVLRCFSGDSMRTGEDLKAELRAGKRSAAVAAGAALLCLALVGSATPAQAAGQETAKAQGTSVAPADLERSISRVISKREYSWRLPRERRVEEEKKGPVAAFIEGVVDAVKKWFRPVGEWISKAVEWIFKHLIRRLAADHGGAEPDRGWSASVPLLMYALLGVAASVLAIMLYRMWRRRRAAKDDLVGEAVAAVPDLTREEVAADELPVNRWLQLAQELLSQGNLRLALRAFFLAALARLAEDQRITIAPSKSNREYEQELRRKAHALRDLVNAFSENRKAFDAVWYGMHEVTQDVMQSFTQNHQRIMAHAGQP